MAFMVLKYFEKLADVKPAKWRLSGGCLTIRWFIGRVLIGDKHILSGCTGYPDKRDKGTFGAGQNKIDPDKRYQRQNENGKPWRNGCIAAKHNHQRHNRMTNNQKR
jgi:hypothetical protein